MAEKKNGQLVVVERMLTRVDEFAVMENTPLNDKDRAFAVDIITNIDKKLAERKTDWQEIDVFGCQLPSQIKRMSRLGLSMSESEIFVDIRNNKNTGKKDITLKKQYQGVRKELLKFCTKEIVRFYSDVICEGDEFEMETDFTTGLQSVIKHTKAKGVDRNKLSNIIGAYEIAYVKEKEDDDTLSQYVAYVDKNRINRAYNASASREKTVWKMDTRLMVLKTASWVLYNNVLKPYVVIPTDLLDDWKETNDQMNFNEEPEEKVVSFEENVIEAEVVEKDVDLEELDEELDRLEEFDDLVEVE